MTLQSLADEIAQLLGRCAWNNTGYLVFMDGHTFRINRLLQGFNQKNAAVSDVEILASEIGQLQSQIMWEQNSLISFMNRHYSILNNDIHIMQQKQGDWYNATMELQREIDAKDASIAELSRRTRVPDESVEMKSSESLSSPLISNDELEELKKFVAELESELTAKDEEMKEIVEESLSLKGQIERLGIKDNELVKSMDLLRNQMETQAETLQGRLAGAESRCKELESEVKSLQEVIKADEKELKELKSVETVWAHPSVPAEIHLVKELKTDLVDTVLKMVDSAFVTLSEVKKIKHSLSLKGIQMAERVDSCLRATTSQHKALMNSVETNERLCNETYADNLQLRDEVTRLEAKVKELGADIKKKTLSLQALEEKHKSLKEDYDMSELACKEAKEEQKRLETMIAASDENTAKLQKQVKDLQTDERKRSDLDVYSKQQENIKKIYEPKDEKEREEGLNLVLTHELQVAIHVENIRLKKQLKDLQAKTTTLSDEQLENDLVELRCEKDALLTEISDLQFTVLTLETENASLQQRIATQKARLDSYEDDVDLYILGENRELQGKVKKSEIDMQNEREEHEELRKKLAHYEEDLKKARFDMEQLKRRNEKTVRIAADIEDYQCNKLNFTRLKDSYINMCIVYDSILDHYNRVKQIKSLNTTLYPIVLLDLLKEIDLDLATTVALHIEKNEAKIAENLETKRHHADGGPRPDALPAILTLAIYSAAEEDESAQGGQLAICIQMFLQRNIERIMDRFEMFSYTIFNYPIRLKESLMNFLDLQPSDLIKKYKECTPPPKAFGPPMSFAAIFNDLTWATTATAPNVDSKKKMKKK